MNISESLSSYFKTESEHIRIRCHQVLLLLAIFVLYKLIAPGVGDGIVDFGIGPYVAWRIQLGEWPSQHWLNIPSAILYTVAFKMFSVSRQVFITTNAGLLCIITLLQYFILRKVTRPAPAFWATLFFLFVSAFNVSKSLLNFNFLASYSYVVPLNYAALLLILSLFLKKRTIGRDLLLGSGMGLMFMMKPEMLSAAIAGFIAFTYFQIKRDGCKAVLVSSLYLFVGFMAAFILTGLAAYALGLPFSEYLNNINTLHLLAMRAGPSQSDYVQRVMGIYNVSKSLEAIWGCLWPILTLCVVLLWAESRGYQKKKLWSIALECTAFIVIIIFMMDEVLKWRVSAVRVVPLALLVLFGWLIRKKESESLIIVTTVALALTAKVAFNAVIGFYAFSYLALGTPLVLAYLGTIEAKMAPRIIAIVYGTAVALSQLTFAADYVISFSKASYGKAGDATAATWPDAMMMSAILDRVSAIVPEGSTLAVYPHGPGLNYRLRRKSPLPFPDILPFGVDALGEDFYMKHFKEVPPEYLLKIPIDLNGILSKTKFGEDYAVAISQYFVNCFSIIAKYEGLYAAPGNEPVVVSKHIQGCDPAGY